MRANVTIRMALRHHHNQPRSAAGRESAGPLNGPLNETERRGVLVGMETDA
jgi:hypothetical protein